MNAILSFFASSFSASTVVTLLIGIAAIGFQQWRLNSAQKEAEEWQALARCQQAATEQLQEEIESLTINLQSREEELKLITQTRKEVETKVAEVIRNEDDSKTWADTPIPDGIRGLLTSARSSGD